ncbi:MAG: KpsF/GutQ family sugar-phosphate isomerase [Planctomycetaceae bacterium]|jgi:arabinose-5-phosphate isomerase|nr:KpsF/GutQ family sugar-phosphate isomerase [Planctomycetaceae bacterium]
MNRILQNPTQNQSERKAKLLQRGRSVMQCERDALDTLIGQLDERFSEAVFLIEKCRGNVMVSGIGKAGIIGQKITATLASTGIRSHFLHPAEAIHGDLGRVGRGDMVMILSYSGETEEIVRLLEPLRRMRVPILAVTASEGSSLGRAAEVVLPLGKFAEADHLDLAPSTSTTLMLALGDALALVLSEERGLLAETFAKYHPGGSLGRKLSLVEEYMRPREECRIAPDTETVREIFVRHKLPGRRTGAVLLVNGDGVLSGIFTDSDLARLFEERNDTRLDRPASEIMTKSPKSVIYGSKMLEAVALMARMKISELPVLDVRRIPLGILDITDVVADFPEYAHFVRNGSSGDQSEDKEEVILKPFPARVA